MNLKSNFPSIAQHVDVFRLITLASCAVPFRSPGLPVVGALSYPFLLLSHWQPRLKMSSARGAFGRECMFSSKVESKLLNAMIRK